MFVEGEHESDELVIHGKQVGHLLSPAGAQPGVDGTEEGVIEDEVDFEGRGEGKEVSILKLHELGGVRGVLGVQVRLVECGGGDVEADDAARGAAHSHHVVPAATSRH